MHAPGTRGNLRLHPSVQLMESLESHGGRGPGALSPVPPPPAPPSDGWATSARLRGLGALH